MYDQQTTQRFLEAQIDLDDQQVRDGLLKPHEAFKAEYHSLSDIEGMSAVLDDVWDHERGRQIRKLNPEESAFIDNERLLCTHDARYHYTRYARVIDVSTRRLTPFVMNAAQEIVFDVWAEMERNQWALMMLQLKARRLGVSSLSEIEVGRRMQFWPETAALVASSTPDKSTALVKIIRDMWDHTPWWLMPVTTKIQDGLPVEFRGHNATLAIQAGNQFSGMGRGQTPSCVHCSEVCEWPNPAEDIDASLLKAILEMSEVFFILESTALGRDNWYHKTWRLSKEGWPNSKLYPMFLPWYVGSDIYPTPAWLRKHPVPSEWMPDDYLVQHAERARRYVHLNPRLRKFMGEEWVMPREQMWYYDFTRKEDERKGELNRFLAEMASDDQEAFQSTNISVFQPNIVLAYRDRIKDPLGVYKLVGVRGSEHEVPVEHRPDSTEIDHGKPSIPIACQWGQYRGEFHLVPVKFQGYSSSASLGRIFIWEWPHPDYEYGFGADTAEGLGQDRGVVEVLRKDTLIRPDGQVAEFASDHLNGLEMWPWCMALGSLYSPIRNGNRQQAKAAIEVRTGGDQLQNELKRRGWSNFLVWPKPLDNRLSGGPSNKLGFLTNVWSRPVMLNILLTWINRFRVEINSPYFIEEMESFEKDEERQKMKAVFGAFDDRIIALGVILFTFHLHENYSDKASLAELREQADESPDPEWDPGFQGRDVNPAVGVPTKVWSQLADIYARKR